MSSYNATCKYTVTRELGTANFPAIFPPYYNTVNSYLIVT